MSSRNAEERDIRKMLSKVFNPQELSNPSELQSLINALSEQPWMKVTLERVTSESRARAEEHQEEDLESRVSRLEDVVESISSDFEFIKSTLENTANISDEPSEKFANMVSKIPEVIAVYCKKVEDGFEFWTLFESPSRIQSLQQIVAAQTRLDRMFKEVYFDFMTDHIDDINKEEFKGWRKIFEKD